MKRKRELLPHWNMPSDPVKAVFWFLHWFLQVLVRYFYILIVLGVLWEAYINWRVGGAWNGIIAGVITLLIGLGVWVGIGVVLLVVKVITGLSKGLTELNRMQQGFPPRRPFYNFMEPDMDGRVVEGSVTDLEEERRKRRPE